MIAKYTSYVLAVTLLSAGLGGITATGFALYYFHAIHLDIPAIIFTIMKIGIFLIWAFAAYQFGLFTRLGISGGHNFDLKNINRAITTFPTISINKNLKDDDYKYLLISLARIPHIVSFSISLGILLLTFLVLMYEIYLEGLIFNKILLIFSVSFIAIFIIICFSLVISEVLTGEMRAQCMQIIHQKKIPMQTKKRRRSIYTVKTKLFFFLILFIITLFISNIMIYYNKERIDTIFGFASLAIFVSLFMAYLIFYIIYNSLKQVENAAYDLMRGGEGMFFPRSLDLEFINLADGINIAAKTIREYQKGLEGKVEERTRELNHSLKILKQKDEIMETELEFAANIQQGIIPAEEDMQPWNGISFAAYYRPMGRVSGDYYDLFRKDDCLYFLLADVSGHGVPAALITMAAKQAFSATITGGRMPSEIFKTVNELLLEKIKTSDYLTAFLFKIDEKHQASYCNASHTKAIHYIHARNEYVLLDSDGMFIGAIAEAGNFYEDKSLKLASGDRIFLYTDGIIEHKNLQGEEFGVDRLISALTDSQFLSLKEQINHVVELLKQFIGSAPIKDDISMFALHLEEKWSRFTEVYNAGVKHLRLNKIKEALLDFAEAQNIIPGYSRLSYQLALAHYGSEQYEKAQPLLEKYLQEHPKDIKGWQLGVNIYLKLGDKNKVKKYMHQISELEKESE